jgi:hypothetical protein
MATAAPTESLIMAAALPELAAVVLAPLVGLF